MNLLVRRYQWIHHFMARHVRHPRLIVPMVRYWLKWGKIVILPLDIDIEPNNTCNFNCEHCQVTQNKGTIEPRYITLELFDKIIKDLPHLRSIHLQGMGEPLLNRKLIDMVRRGEAQNISMSFTSNASLCDERTSNELAKLKNTQITFSIDGATKSTFERIRKGGVFETVKKNISYLTTLRKRSNGPRVAIWSVITKQNVEEATGIVELAIELGVDVVNLQLFLTNWGDRKMQEGIEALTLNSDDAAVKSTLERALGIAKKANLPMNIYPGKPFSRDNPCNWPWRRTYITAGGDVVPCCQIANAKIINLGNIFKESFEDIWYSKKYHDFRERIESHQLHEFCKQCYTN